jgi:tetratricopeptide (TPR) repeat protein
MSQETTASENAVQAVLHQGTQINTFSLPQRVRCGKGVPPSVDIPFGSPGKGELEGREEILQMFLGRFRRGEGRTGCCEVLCGLGGVGKTTLARELAFRVRDMGVSVWWVPAENRDRMVDALCAVAVSAGADPADLLSVNPADVLWDALRGSGRPWAIFVDALDDISSAFDDTLSNLYGCAARWLRQPPAGCLVCVNSRDCRTERWGSWVTINKIECLDPENGGRILLRHSPHSGDRSSAERLSRALGGLPLALTIASRYLNRQTTDPFPVSPRVLTFTEYTRLLHERLEGIEENLGEPTTIDLPSVLRATWEISVERLHHEGLVRAREILRFFACLADSPIPYVPLLEALRARQRGQQSSDWTVRQISDTLRGLEGASLIELHRAAGTEEQDPWRLRVGLHPVVRAVTRGELRQSQDWYPMVGRALTALRDVADGLSPDSLEDWDRWELICEHALSLMRAVDPGEQSGDLLLEAVDLGHRAAWAQYLLGRFDQAEEGFRAVLRKLSEHTPPDGRRIVCTHSCLGRAVREAGRPREAAEILRATVERATGELGERDETTLDARVNLARTLREIGENDLAEAMFTNILQIASDTLGGEHELSVVARLNRARCLRDREAHAEAVPEYLSAFEAWTRSHPGISLMSLDIRYEMAENQRLAGELDRAEDAYRPLRAEAIEFLGRSHPNTSLIRRGWAVLLESKGHPAPARDELQDVLTVQMESLGDRHPQVLETLQDLSRIEPSVS